MWVTGRSRSARKQSFWALLGLGRLGLVALPVGSGGPLQHRHRRGGRGLGPLGIALRSREDGQGPDLVPGQSAGCGKGGDTRAVLQGAGHPYELGRAAPGQAQAHGQPALDGRTAVFGPQLALVTGPDQLHQRRPHGVLESLDLAQRGGELLARALRQCHLIHGHILSMAYDN